MSRLVRFYLILYLLMRSHDTGLESVSIPDSVLALRRMCFYKCESLRHVELVRHLILNVLVPRLSLGRSWGYVTCM